MDCKTRSCTIVEQSDGGVGFKKFLIGVGAILPTLVLIVTNIMIFLKVRSLAKQRHLEAIQIFP